MAKVKPLKRYCPRLVTKTEFGTPSYYGTVIRVEDQHTVLAKAFVHKEDARMFMIKEAGRLNATRGPIGNFY